MSVDVRPFLGTPNTPVVITGGASGIGRETARALAAVGRPVVLWDLDDEVTAKAAAEIAAEFSVNTHGAAVDVRDVTTLHAAAEEARSVVGPIGGLVHAAGVSRPKPIDELSAELWDDVVGVHLRPIPFLVKELQSDLASSPDAAVVLIASIAGLIGYVNIDAYVASKTAMLGLARSLGLTLAPHGIRANAVCPGYTDTPMMQGRITEQMLGSTPLRRVAQPDDIARAVRFLLSNEAAFITGTSLVVDGGYIAGRT